MRIFVVGDLHLRKNKEYKTLLDELLDLSITLNPDIIVHLGDTLHTNSNIDLGCLTDACNFFMRSAELAPTYVLIGNHDRRNNSDYLSDCHPFVGLESVPNLHIAHKVLRVKNEDGSTFAFVPYVPVGKFRDALKTVGFDLEESRPDLIFAHQQFEGSIPFNNKGDSWSSDLPYVISGHIHGHLRLPGILYTGSPVQHKFSESQDKSVWLIETDSLSHKVIKEERIRLKSIKIKRDLEYKFEDLKRISKELNYIVNPQFETRVYLTADESKMKSLKSSPEYLELSKYPNVKIVPNEIKDEARTVELCKRNISLDERIREKLKGNKRALSLYETIV